MGKHICLIFFVALLYKSALCQRAFDPEIKSSSLPSSDGYRQRFNDERYEGLYTKKVSSQTEILSLTLGKIQYDLSEDEKLVLQSPQPVKDKIVGVTGKSFGLNKYYRFDLLLKGKEKKEIPVNEIIGKKFIYSQNLGIYGYTGEVSDPSLYIPVRVSSRHYPGSNELNLVIVSNAGQDKVQWKYSLMNEAGDCSAFLNGTPVTGGPEFPAGIPIQIQLSFPASVKSGTELCIQIDFQNSGSKRWENKSFKLLLP